MRDEGNRKSGDEERRGEGDKRRVKRRISGRSFARRRRISERNSNAKR